MIEIYNNALYHFYSRNAASLLPNGSSATVAAWEVDSPIVPEIIIEK